MVAEVEVTSFDLRYEGCRIGNKAAEKALLSSILEYGIRDPLQGVDTKEGRMLLDGFKRYRCARRLGIGIVPYSCLGRDAAAGIIQLLRIANAKSLSIIEQAKLIDELRSVHHMSVVEIARVLEKSPAWVSVRAGIIAEMTPLVMRAIVSGAFPVYSYMYTVRSFMRINRIKKEEIDTFVSLAAGKGLSIRDIELLAHGYFKGPEHMRQQIAQGNLSWGLSRMKHTSLNAAHCTERERHMLRELDSCQKYMQRIISKSTDRRFKSNTFYAEANLLAGGIMRKLAEFGGAIRAFYDRTRKTQGDSSPS
jgi:hypothetical protein